MDTDATKELLHLRIEQADEKLLAVLAELTETLFRSYQPDAVEESTLLEEKEEAVAQAAPSWVKPMTKEESLSELRLANEEGERGEVVPIEDLEKTVEP